jgi:hypothetical protein
MLLTPHIRNLIQFIIFKIKVMIRLSYIVVETNLPITSCVCKLNLVLTIVIYSALMARGGSHHALVVPMLLIKMIYFRYSLNNKHILSNSISFWDSKKQHLARVLWKLKKKIKKCKICKGSHITILNIKTILSLTFGNKRDQILTIKIITP